MNVLNLNEANKNLMKHENKNLETNKPHTDSDPHSPQS